MSLRLDHPGTTIPSRWFRARHDAIAAVFECCRLHLEALLIDEDTGAVIAAARPGPCGHWRCSVAQPVAPAVENSHL